MLAIYQLFSKHKLFEKGDVSTPNFIIRESDAYQMFCLQENYTALFTFLR